MVLTRKYEEKVAYLFMRGEVHGTTHLCMGQEATSVGSVMAMRQDDFLASNHRGHGHAIAKGSDINLMLAELLGKANGYCKGKGGSMHIADLNLNNLGANGVVGGGIPLAVGAGITVVRKKMDKAVICIFGDGATNQGAFHEALNMASIWKLPIVFVCENNQYGMSGSIKRMAAIDDLSIRASAYGMPGQRIDGNDVLAVYAAVREARERVIKNGPELIVCETYRINGHSKSDANAYRTKEEIAQWKAKCPILRFRKLLVDDHVFTDAEIDAIDASAQETIDEAVRFAQASPLPQAESLLEDIYA
jgi:pyruvate dehydrogenase E1 component alpha subunit